MVTFNNEQIFIVDDDDPVRDSLKTLLETCDLQVSDFASCQDFLDQHRTGQGGCLLLDLHLPVMSGLEFMENFGSRLQDMPVIMISGRCDAATLARARRAGIAAFLEKPFADEALLDLIGRLLPSQRPSAAASA